MVTHNIWCLLFEEILIVVADQSERVGIIDQHSTVPYQRRLMSLSLLFTFDEAAGMATVKISQNALSVFIEQPDKTIKAG